MEFCDDIWSSKPYNAHEFANREMVYADKALQPTDEQRALRARIKKGEYISDLIKELKLSLCELRYELEPHGDPLKSLLCFADMAKIMVKIMEAEYGDKR